MNSEQKLDKFLETTDYSPYFENIKKSVEDWAEARNLIKGATAKDQFHKLVQEVGEFSDDLCKGKDVRLEFGDILVVLIIMAKQLDIDPTECLIMAYNKIKDRTGKMVNGVFVKSDDL